MSLPHDERSATRPVDDLADVWAALDTLPRQSASVDMAATTVEMVAARLDADALPAGASSVRGWPVPFGLVAASLVAGVVAGRIIAPDPDVRVLESLPLVRHVDLLREAGSVTFLQSLAGRRNQLAVRLPPPVVRDANTEFDAAIRDLEGDHRWGGGVDRETLAARSEAVAALSVEGREALERSLGTFQWLSSGQRRDLAALAAALADPRREEVREAARLWHQMIAASEPADRKNIVDLDTEQRIEWIERRARQREWNGDRRGPPSEGVPLPRGQRPSPGPDGRPRPPRPNGPRN